MLTIITEISSLTGAGIYSISQFPKQLNAPVKQGKHFPSVQWALDSPRASCPSAPEAEPGSAAAKQGVLALCRASKAQPLLSRAQSQPCTPGKKPQAQKQPDRAGMIPQPRATRVLNYTGAGNHNSSLEWRSVQQQPGILHAATWGSTLHCPFPVLCPAICHPSELIMYDWHKRQNFNTDV